MNRAVDAKAHAHMIALGIEVNVGYTFPAGVGEQRFHQGGCFSVVLVWDRFKGGGKLASELRRGWDMRFGGVHASDGRGGRLRLKNQTGEGGEPFKSARRRNGFDGYLRCSFESLAGRMPARTGRMPALPRSAHISIAILSAGGT